MLQTKKEIKKWLDRYSIKKYHINDDLTVDVATDVNLVEKGLLEIPIQFSVIDGAFYCNSNFLASLKGCPFEVKRTFNCALNPIISLNYCPKIIKDDFNSYSTRLTSLQGLDCKIGGNFLHSCHKFDRFMIKDLANYYIEKDNPISGGKYWDLELSGKELGNIISRLNLNKELTQDLNQFNLQEKKKLKL